MAQMHGGGSNQETTNATDTKHVLASYQGSLPNFIQYLTLLCLYMSLFFIKHHRWSSSAYMNSYPFGSLEGRFRLMIKCQKGKLKNHAEKFGGDR